MNRLGSFLGLLILCISNTIAAGQELNVGVHVSPIVSIPVLDKIGTSSPTLKTKTYTVNASGGLNINLRLKNVCIESGANITSRSIAFKMRLDNYTYNNLNGSVSVSSQSDVRAIGTAWAIPLQVGILLDHHEATTTYDLFGILGASYENHTVDLIGYEEASITTSNNNPNAPNISNVRNLKPEIGDNTSWYNAIIGFKINAILRNVGLIEYGLRYHYPLKNAGQHHVETLVANNTYGSAFIGDFYPRLSYVDFHLTYYFLNFQRKGKPKYNTY